MLSVAERIKKHEGFRVNVYDDQLGNKTGGYGHLMLEGETEPEGGYTKEYWEGVFQKDFKTAVNGVDVCIVVTQSTVPVRPKPV